MDNKINCHIYAKFDCVVRMGNRELFLLAGENRPVFLPNRSVAFVYPFGKEKLLSYCFRIGDYSPYVKQYVLGENKRQVFLEKLSLPNEPDSSIVQTETNGNVCRTLSHVGDMAGRGMVNVFKEGEATEKHYVYLDNESSENQTILAPVAFLEAVRAEDFAVAKKMLSEKLSGALNTEHMRKFFPQQSEIVCYRENNKNIFACLGQEAKMFEFTLDEKGNIDDINELD